MEFAKMKFSRQLRIFAVANRHTGVCLILVVNQLFRWFKSQNDFNNKNTPFGAFFYLNWLREMDLNQRPSGYEPDELPDCSIPRWIGVIIY